MALPCPQDCDSFAGSRSWEPARKERLERPSLGQELGIPGPRWRWSLRDGGDSKHSWIPPGLGGAPGASPHTGSGPSCAPSSFHHPKGVPQPLGSSSTPSSGLEREDWGAGSRAEPGWGRQGPVSIPGVLQQIPAHPVVTSSSMRRLMAGGIPPGTPRVPGHPTPEPSLKGIVLGRAKSPGFSPELQEKRKDPAVLGLLAKLSILQTAPGHQLGDERHGDSPGREEESAETSVQRRESTWKRN